MTTWMWGQVLVVAQLLTLIATFFAEERFGTFPSGMGLAMVSSVLAVGNARLGNWEYAMMNGVIAVMSAAIVL